MWPLKLCNFILLGATPALAILEPRSDLRRGKGVERPVRRRWPKRTTAEIIVQLADDPERRNFRADFVKFR